MVIQLESEDAAPTITPSSLIPQILVSQQMPPSQQSNPTSTLEQKQLSLESNTNEKLSTDINDSTPDSESLKPTKKEDTEIVIPQLKSVIGPGQGEEHCCGNKQYSTEYKISFKSGTLCT